jgi:hypothetical protein
MFLLIHCLACRPFHLIFRDSLLGTDSVNSLAKVRKCKSHATV